MGGNLTINGDTTDSVVISGGNWTLLGSGSGYSQYTDDHGNTVYIHDSITAMTPSSLALPFTGSGPFAASG